MIEERRALHIDSVGYFSVASIGSKMEKAAMRCDSVDDKDHNLHCTIKVGENQEVLGYANYQVGHQSAKIVEIVELSFKAIKGKPTYGSVIPSFIDFGVWFAESCAPKNPTLFATVSRDQVNIFKKYYFALNAKTIGLQDNIMSFNVDGELHKGTTQLLDSITASYHGAK